MSPLTSYIYLVSIGLLFLCAQATDEVNQETYDRYLSMFQGRMFSVACENDEAGWSEWTGCVWPQGDLRHLLVRFLKEAKDVDCKVPPRNLIKAGLDFLATDNGRVYMSHPLYSKIPNNKCGRCARKAQCCTSARSFLTQAFRSQPCTNDWAACQVEPLTDGEIESLRQWYPTVEANMNDRCDFSPWMNDELRKLHNGPAFAFLEKPLCQLLGTTRPTFSCVTAGSTCRCCCFGYEYDASNGECVAIQSTGAVNSGCPA